MRAFLYILCCGAVIGVAYWAYKENYQTQNSIRRVDALQKEIIEQRDAISIMSAEWAYLNRPDRLRKLVDLNFEDLGLMPLLPEHFADVELVTYPQLELKIDDVTNPVSVISPDGEYP